MPRPQGGAHADPERRPGPAPRRATPWLRVHGKRGKSRDLPIPSEVADALGAWRARHRARIFGVDEALLFPRLGSRGRDGRYPDAGGRLSGRALGFIVAATLG
jgi:integrase